MYEDGVIHEVIWDHLLDRAFHLELRCVSCQVSDTQTRLWLTKEYLNRALDLISVAVNKRVVNDFDNNAAMEQLMKKKSDKPDILEDGVVRVACIFRSDHWASNRPKILARSDHEQSFGNKYYLHGEVVVASVALLSSQTADDLSKTLYREIGVNVQPESNTLSKYFPIVGNNE